MQAHRQTTAVSSPPKRTLVIMAKAPRPGVVKTRLAQSLPAAAVTSLYCCLLQDTVALARSLNDVQVAVMCRESDTHDLKNLLGNTLPIVTQNGEGLAAGLTSVFRHFTADGQGHVIAFNSDSPHLSSSVLDNAFQILTTHEIVVGPTHDGGYYLVGAKAAYPSLFEGDGMGTRSALDRLLARARELDLSTGFTGQFYDIDVAGDLVRLGQELRVSPGKAPRTAAWFSDWQQAVVQLRQSLGDL
jgi:rSAM/selenodomain-associated transferase 1